LHGPSKGEFVKSHITLPPALVAPDLIKLESLPTKKVYDFTKHSQNYRLFDNNEAMHQPTNYSLENLEYEEKRCDSRLKEEDLKLLEIELRKKQKKRIKKERRIAEGHIPNRRRAGDDDEEEAKQAVDENGNAVRRAD